MGGIIYLVIYPLYNTTTGIAELLSFYLATLKPLNADLDIPNNMNNEYNLLNRDRKDPYYFFIEKEQTALIGSCIQFS